MPRAVACRTFLRRADVVRKIGSGGYGTVDLMERDDGKRYAVKKIKQRGDPVTDCEAPGITTSALREMDFLTRFRACPYIINLVGVCVRDRDIAIIMPPMPYDLVTLANKLDDAARQHVASFLLYSLVSASATMEALNVAHFDIKPGNVLARVNGNDVEFRLADFGLSRLYVDSSVEWLDVYTAQYAPPEVAVQGYSFNGRKNADVWSIAVTVVEWCLGENMFAARTLHGMVREFLPPSYTIESFIAALSRDEIDGGLDVEGIVDDPLDDVVMHMLSYSPSERPTASEILWDEFHETPSVQPCVSTETLRDVDWAGVNAILPFAELCAVPPHPIEMYTRHTTRGGERGLCHALACVWLSEKYIDHDPITLCDVLLPTCTTRDIVRASEDVLATLGYLVYDIHLTPVIPKCGDLSAVDFSLPLPMWHS